MAEYERSSHIIQRSLGNDLLLEVGYIGTKGTKLPRFVEGNPTVFVPGNSSPDNVDQRRLHSGCGLEDPESDCIYASTGLITGNTNSSYHALQTSARKRFSHGVSFLASYTYLEIDRLRVVIQYDGISSTAGCRRE